MLLSAFGVLTFNISCVSFVMHGSRGGTFGPDPSLKNHKNIGFLSITIPDLLKNHKATKPAFNVEPSLVRQEIAIKWPIMA